MNDLDEALGINADQRKEFEDKLYADYFTRGIKYSPVKAFAVIRNGRPKHELFARSRDGQYIENEISAMWHGWKLARGLIR